MKVIVTDLEYRKAFDLFHLFRSLGYEVAGYSGAGAIGRGLLSLIYRQKIHPLHTGERYGEELRAGLAGERGVYFPVEEETTLRFYRMLLEGGADGIASLLPPPEAFATVRDKRVFSDFCRVHDLPVPRAYEIDELRGMERFPGPLIVKPRIGSGSIGIRFVNTAEELEALDLDWDAYLIQERLPHASAVEGGFFLFDRGRPVTYYGHRRVRTYPPEGGVSVYSRCEMNDAVREVGERLLSKLEWSGIAMVETLFDPKEECYKIIEVNPRAWGSIMLSEHCGSGMLENYVRLATGAPEKPARIRTDRYIRWFFPWDLLTYLRTKGRIDGFWNFEPEKCCYINISYAPPLSALLFTLYNIADPAKLTKFIKKVFG